MNYYVKTVNTPRSLGCTIKTGANLAPEIEGECPLLPVSVVYGVCRILRKSTTLRDMLIPLSYFYRFPHKTRRGVPKVPHSRALWITLPAEYFGLSHKIVLARLLVAADGITITRVLVTDPDTEFSPFPWEKVYTLKT